MIFLGNHSASKNFYFKLIKLYRDPWNISESQKPSISTYQIYDGEVPEEWIQRHNYTGLYDMVWLPELSYLICSCYDTIQVWDMVNYERVNIFEAAVLDSKWEKATCFYGCGPALVTGTDKGRLQAFDLLTCQRIGETEQKQFELLSDVKGYKDSLLCVDWRGLLIQWKWRFENGKMTFKLMRTFKPAFPENDEEIANKYNARFCERLVDFNDTIGVTNSREVFCIFDIKTCQIATWIRTYKSVLCMQVIFSRKIVLKTNFENFVSIGVSKKCLLGRSKRYFVPFKTRFESTICSSPG